MAGDDGNRGVAGDGHDPRPPSRQRPRLTLAGLLVLLALLGIAAALLTLLMVRLGQSAHASALPM
ncbi:MAG: hypothetical protein LBJ87_02240 [bacterium]|nr:hypothetical protein [bacterium]